MALVKYREYEVEQSHFESRALTPALPVVWVRDNLKVGDKLGVFIDSDNPNRIVIEKLLDGQRPS